MNVAATSAGAGASAAPQTRSFGDTQDFMTLLIAQLQAQDPLSPMDPSELMAQLSSLQSVAELQTISGLLAADSGEAVVEALAMIGRTVHWSDPETGEAMQAVVERVEIAGGTCTLIVGDTELSLAEISAVSN
jgi:flagellar basal-body rod modification protein FlgD